MEQFRDRVGVVTGGGSGIGRGIALALAKEGMHVAVADIEEAAAESVADELRALGVRAIGVQADVSKQPAMDALAETVYGEFGACHLLVNDAGVSYSSKLDELTEADWAWVMSVNLYGIVNGCRAFVPRMKAQGGDCHIVNTTSTAGVTDLTFLDIGLYTSSKYAATGFSEMLRGELEPFGIGVSVLCPGLVRTNLGATSARNRPGEFGGPLAEPARRDPSELGPGSDPEEIGPQVVAAIRANRGYIFSHPEDTRPHVEARFQRMRDDLDWARDNVLNLS